MEKTSMTLLPRQIVWLRRQASNNDCSVSEIVRHLIVQAQRPKRKR